MGDIAFISCSCGGVVEKVETTEDEEREHGCGRKDCCVKAFACIKCKTRFIIGYYATEIE